MDWFNIEYFELARICGLFQKANKVLMSSTHLCYLNRNQSLYFESNEMTSFYITGALKSWAKETYSTFSNERNAQGELLI